MSKTVAEQFLELSKGLDARMAQVEEMLKAAGQAHHKGVTPAELFAQKAKDGAHPSEFLGLGVDQNGNPAPVFGKRLHKGVGMGKFLVDLLSVSKAPEAQASEERMAAHGSRLLSKAALAESSGATGGYTVPPQFVAQLLMLAAEQSIVRQLATVIPMTGRNVFVPALDHTGGAAGVSPFLGGVVATWTEESQTRQETEPTFKQVELVAHELSMYTLASNTLISDTGIALDALLSSLFAAAIAWYEDYAFLRGDGVGKPLGVLSAPPLVAVTRTSANLFKLADAANMMGRLLPSSMGTACWVMSQTVIPQLIQLADGGGNVVFIPNFGGAAPGMGGAAMRMPMTLLGLPIFFTEKLPALGTQGDVLLCDFSKYLVGDRMELAIEVSREAKFLQNQTAWRVVARVDGQPWLTAAPTLADGATTVSPFVAVAA